MAYGIEELAEMKVTGPVQGGDMVAKPNEMPVGAAALLSKMQKKNTPGIFKLPEADKKMPSFMKVAAEGVEEQNTANLEDAEIMRIMRQYGVGPEEARKIYDDMIYGYERDEAAINPSDWRSILKMIESGMSQEEIDEQLAAVQFPGNFTDNPQKVKTVPTNLKTRPDAPETTLAYITPEEQGILAMLNPGTPHMGPEGIPSYDSYDYGTYTTSEDWTGYDTGKDEGPKAYIEARDKAASGDTSNYSQEEIDRGQAARDQKTAQAEIALEAAQGGGKFEDYKEGQESGLGEIIQTAAGQGWDFAKGLPIMAFKAVDALSGALDGWEEKQVEDLISKLGTGEAATGWGNLLHDFKTGRKDSSKWLEEWGDKLGEGEHKETKWDDKSPEEQLDEILRLAKGSGGNEFMKHYDPEEYYKDPKNWDAKEMAQAQKEGKLKFTPANTRMIEEGRRLLEREQGGDRGQGRGSGGSGSTPVDEVQVTENVDVDPRAGAFNVGGTMKYTDDLRTGGTEMDVPLGRRFAIDKSGKYRGSTPMDLSEAVKYATLGGYGQLEPFQEYLTRRRKELGEQPDEWFDEEGNVLFSKQA
tara:strand:+ start:889 stop:2640 length:1752 start_codon:yes stop_codon:yes gene_type:complete